MGRQAGQVESVDGKQDALSQPGVHSCLVRVAEGDTLTPLRSSFDRIVSVTAEGATAAEALANAQAAVSRVTIKVRPPGS
jgi:hypothetical protein